MVDELPCTSRVAEPMWARTSSTEMRDSDAFTDGVLAALLDVLAEAIRLNAPPAPEGEKALRGTTTRHLVTTKLRQARISDKGLDAWITSV
jgi:hypothetical protein